MFWDAYLIKFELFIVECKGVFFNLIIVFASIVHCVIHSWWLVSSPAIFLAGYIWWSNQRVIFMIRVLPGLACNELCIRATLSHHQMQSGPSTRNNLGTRNFSEIKIRLKHYRIFLNPHCPTSSEVKNLPPISHAPPLMMDCSHFCDLVNFCACIGILHVSCINPKIAPFYHTI